MKKSILLCDVKGCVSAEAHNFSFFKDRRLDGAGSCENWYYSFDLCVNHAITLLEGLLGTFEKSNKADLIKMANQIGIKMSEQ